jgi:hypothetical protein
MASTDPYDTTPKPIITNDELASKERALQSAQLAYDHEPSKAHREALLAAIADYNTGMHDHRVMMDNLHDALIAACDNARKASHLSWSDTVSAMRVLARRHPAGLTTAQARTAVYAAYDEYLAHGTTLYNERNP